MEPSFGGDAAVPVGVILHSCSPAQPELVLTCTSYNPRLQNLSLWMQACPADPVRIPNQTSSFQAGTGSASPVWTAARSHRRGFSLQKGLSARIPHAPGPRSSQPHSAGRRRQRPALNTGKQHRIQLASLPMSFFISRLSPRHVPQPTGRGCAHTGGPAVVSPLPSHPAFPKDTLIPFSGLKTQLSRHS